MKLGGIKNMKAICFPRLKLKTSDEKLLWVVNKASG